VQAGSNSLIPQLFILFVALGAAAFICIICFLIGILTGWHALSERFRAQSEPYGQGRCVGPFFYNVYMRYWSHYSSVIRMTAADDALYLSVIFAFRLFHPPLRIPWSEVKLGRTKYFWRQYVVLTLGDQEHIPMRISERMARKLGILDRLPN
jgi:hypothetical protein